jgi:uncharacterized heparinase superfamily protein
MSGSLLDQTKVAALAVRRAGRSAVTMAKRSPLSRWMAGVPTAYHLLILPQDLRTGDPSVAAELYDGYLGLAGATAGVGSETPFAIRPPSAAWEKELYAFAWLRHLHAAEGPIPQERARKLVLDWIKASSRAPAIARDTDVTARRAIATLSHAAFLLDGADPDFYDAVMQMLSRDLHHLTVSTSLVEGVPRLRALVAVLLAGLCVAEQEAYLSSFLPTFCAEVERQILSDGGHISRDPSTLVELLLEFLPLKQCFISRQIETPEALALALRRMPPMLRYMRLGDGSIAHFNGMGPTYLDQVSTVFAYDDRFETLNGVLTENSRYARLSAGDIVALMDAGAPPTMALSNRAHAGCASFEMSVGYEPLIVNCGAPPDESSDWAIVSRSTAAHSTLTIDDLSSSKLIEAKETVNGVEQYWLSGPKTVKAEVADNESATQAAVVHDGYREKFGLLHRRTLTLFRTGTAIEGHDQLLPAGHGEGMRSNSRVAVRFHLHPRVSATLARNSNTVTLVTAGGQAWRFVTNHADIDIEESLFFADPICLRRSLQIVLKAPAMPATSIAWRIEKATGHANAPEPAGRNR